jgi:hypothetical protein
MFALFNISLGAACDCLYKFSGEKEGNKYLPFIFFLKLLQLTFLALQFSVILDAAFLYPEKGLDWVS